MAKTRFIKGFGVLFALVILVLIVISFFKPWYHYGGDDGYITESFHGVTSGLGSLAWSDTPFNHLAKYYLIVLAILVFTSFFQLLMTMLTLLLFFTNYLPLRIRLGMKYMQKKVKRMAIVLSVLVLIGVGIAVFGLLRHPVYLSEDLGFCGFGGVCSNFSGSGYGPDIAWIMSLIAFICAVLQVALVFLYAFKGLRKRVKYHKIES